MKLRRQYLEQQLRGDYRIERLVGRGGMGEVWAARDLKLGCAVAIKVVDEELSQHPAFAARFEREARMLAKFSHPRIVGVKTAGILTEDRRLYIVMELLRGRTLREILDEQRAAGEVLDHVTAAFYAWQALEGLWVAHDAGIVHLDVKPDNMMIDAADNLKLLDFGLARAAEATGPLGEAAGGRRERLSASTLLGTARYMAPERIVHRRGDARSDLYSMGVVLLEMLTGQHLHKVNVRDEAAVLRAHVDQEPVLRCEKNPDCPDAVWTTALRLVEKDPERRYQEAGEARAELGAILRKSQLPPSHKLAEKLAEQRREEAVRKAFEERPKPHSVRSVQGTRDGEGPDPTAPLGPGFVSESPCAPVPRQDGGKGGAQTEVLGQPAVVVDVNTLRVGRGRAWAVDVESLRAQRRRTVPMDVTKPVPVARAASRIPAWVAKPQATVQGASVREVAVPPRRRPSRALRLVGVVLGGLLAWVVLMAAMMARAMMQSAPEGLAPPGTTPTPPTSATPPASAMPPASATPPPVSATPPPVSTTPPSSAKTAPSTKPAARQPKSSSRPPLPFAQPIF